MGEQEYVFDLGSSSVKEVCAVIQFYVDTNEGEVSCNFGTPNSHYARIEFSLSSAWHGFPSFDQLTSCNEQEQYSTMTLLTLHGKTTLCITPVVGDWLVFKPHVDKIIAHLLPTSDKPLTPTEQQPAVAAPEETPTKILPASIEDELINIRNPKVKAMVKEYIEVVFIRKEYGKSRETVAEGHNFDPSTITRNLPERYKQVDKRRTKR